MVTIKLFMRKNTLSEPETRVLKENALRIVPQYREMLSELSCDKPTHGMVSTQLRLYIEDQSIEFAKVCCSEFQIRIIDRIRTAAPAPV